MSKSMLKQLKQTIVFFILCFYSGSTAYAQEQISTWGFAQNIGWKGLDMSYGILGGYPSYIQDLPTLQKYSDPEIWMDVENQLPDTFNYLDISALYKPLSLYGVFVPFRNAKSKFISRIEWHAGFELQLASPGSIYEYNYHDFKVRMHNRNLLLNNKLFVEQRISKSIEMYGGPNLKFTLIPSEHLELAKFDYTYNNSTGFGVKFIPESRLNQLKFAFGSGLTLGFKFNLSCRFNIHLEYQYQYMYRLMKFGTFSTSYHGGTIGIRYKFIKPDPNDEDSKNPFW